MSSSLYSVLVILLGILVQSKENHKHTSPHAKSKSATPGVFSKKSYSSELGQECTKDIEELKSRESFHDLTNCNENQEDTECSDLNAHCMECALNSTCLYGHNYTVSCIPKYGVKCKNNNKECFSKLVICQYCYQAPMWQQVCNGNGVQKCTSSGTDIKRRFRTNCTVIPSLICLGNRNFERMMPCKWKNGYRWSTTLILSITLGGFGADRFYLGRWQEGIGKLFSFGGLGLWTIVDIILILVRYLSPADGSVYVD